MINLEEYISLSKEERQKHIDLTEPCLERGGNSTNHRGVLAQFLNTSIPGHRIVLAHACNNGKCSNPKHLYWGTHKENTEDAIEFGTHKTIFEKTVLKYGREQTFKIMRKNSQIGSSKGGKANLGKAKSESHREKISESLKGRKFITNGFENKQVHPEEISKYLDLGWKLGMKKRM